MKIEAWCRTDMGLRRESNQDSFLVNQSLGLYVVADGMGGHSGGEVASSMAVKTAEQVLSTPALLNLPPRDAAIKAMEEANRRIYSKASEANSQLMGMGTTMVMAYHRGNSIFIGNVGDSRCYLFANEALWQLTEDHSLINEQLRAGLLSEAQIRSSVGRNVITRSVGYEANVMPDILQRMLVPNEIYLICSDGLSSLVPDEKIQEVLTREKPENMANACVDLALKCGGDDNVTVMILHVQGN